MTHQHNAYKSLLILAAGAKGAIGSTLAASIAALRHDSGKILPYLTTADRFPRLFPPQAVNFAGWDVADIPMTSAVRRHGVLPESAWTGWADEIDRMPVLSAPPANADMASQADRILRDIRALSARFPESLPVFVNLLPSCGAASPDAWRTTTDIIRHVNPVVFPDMAYALGAVSAGIPVVNFTPNPIECAAVAQEAIKSGVPIAGCDGKTGQTFFKVVLASAFRARNLRVDGWYSLNILGNSDGKNLMNPERASGKLANKTQLLDDILGYPVGGRYGESAHKVLIDYYPPRGDAKEAWDVIDLNGIFDMPMSLRINLQGRDSILAAPLVLDLARWMAALSLSGRRGLIPELGFYFKKPMGDSPPVTFQEQLNCLNILEQACNDDAFSSTGDRS
jgi:myo-inositol-1-phosphate synthase